MTFRRISAKFQTTKIVQNVKKKKTCTNLINTQITNRCINPDIILYFRPFILGVYKMAEENIKSALSKGPNDTIFEIFFYVFKT